MNSLPIIDIAPLYHSDPAGWPQVAQQIDQACRQWGFFYIKGHPISAARIAELKAAAVDFFAHPDAEKLLIKAPIAGRVLAPPEVTDRTMDHMTKLVAWA